MPNLRQRKDDIPGLLHYFIQHYASRYQRDVTGFDHSSMQQLIDYHWPGNVRELQNLVERHIALADQPLMQVQNLANTSTGSALDDDLPDLNELERRYILKVLAYFDNNKEQTAQTLGINSSTLWRKLKSYQQ